MRSSLGIINILVLCFMLIVIAGCGGDDPSTDTETATEQGVSDTTAPTHSQPRSATANGTNDDQADQTLVDEVLNDQPAEPDDPMLRKWLDADGNVLAVGKFISVMDGNACLETADGLGAVVPIAQLCSSDRQFVNSQSGADLTLDESQVKTGTTVAGIPQAYDEPDTHADEVLSGIAGLTDSPTAGSESATSQRVVIPFDFRSDFDNGRYGQMTGSMFWKKLDSEGGVVIPDAMDDVRSMCQFLDFHPDPSTSLDEMKKVVTQDFAAHIAIWGQVERVPGYDWDVYDLTIRCVDFSQSEPKVIYEIKQVRTETVSEIPHLYAKNTIDKLFGREPGQPAPPDPLVEQNWIENPNLVVGGDFQQGNGGVPNGWESRGGQDREPLGNLVRWVEDASDPGNKVVRFTFDAGVGNGFGVMYYSLPFPIEEGATYRFQCRYRTNGPKIIIFIKCYDLMDSDYKAESKLAQIMARHYVPEEKELRECYRSQQNMKGAKNQWHTHTQDFTPRHTKYTPRFGKVMLYSYLGAGVTEFDDIVIKQVKSPSGSESKQGPRHSLESTVTIEEMQQNEQRARQQEEEQNAEQ